MEVQSLWMKQAVAQTVCLLKRETAEWCVCVDAVYWWNKCSGNGHYTKFAMTVLCKNSDSFH